MGKIIEAKKSAINLGADAKADQDMTDRTLGANRDFPNISQR